MRPLGQRAIAELAASWDQGNASPGVAARGTSGAVVAASARKEAKTRRVFIDAPKKKNESGE